MKVKAFLYKYKKCRWDKNKLNMEIKIIKNSINRQELARLARESFGDMVKAVVDVRQEIMAVGGGLHSDAEVELSEKESSRREFTWGINLYPEKLDDDWIEFDSMVNLKPQFGNRSRGVENAEIRAKIRAIVDKLVKD